MMMMMMMMMMLVLVRVLVHDGDVLLSQCTGADVCACTG